MKRATRWWIWLSVLCFVLAAAGAAGAQEAQKAPAPAAGAGATAAGAAATGGAAEEAAAPEDWFGGSVTAYDAGTLEPGPAELKVKDEEGAEKSFWINKDTPVYVDGEDGKAADIKSGDEVELSYEAKDGKSMVIDLDVFRNLDFQFDEEGGAKKEGAAAAGAKAPAPAAEKK